MTVDERRAVLLDMTAEDAEPAIRAMTDAEVETMLREHAGEILASREGTPPENIEHALLDDVVAAALAPAGQPCADCGKLVEWRESGGAGDWYHVETPTGCFLARSDER
jgi:hypothetical protein